MFLVPYSRSYFDTITFGVSSVKQKLRHMGHDWVLKIKEEVTKQIDAGFLIVTEYPQWVANIVLVPRKNRGIRVCIDF